MLSFFSCCYCAFCFVQFISCTFNKTSKCKFTTLMKPCQPVNFVPSTKLRLLFTLFPQSMQFLSKQNLNCCIISHMFLKNYSKMFVFRNN